MPIVLIGANNGVMKVNDAWPVNPIVSLVDIFGIAVNIAVARRNIGRGLNMLKIWKVIDNIVIL